MGVLPKLEDSVAALRGRGGRVGGWIPRSERQGSGTGAPEAASEFKETLREGGRDSRRQSCHVVFSRRGQLRRNGDELSWI